MSEGQRIAQAGHAFKTCLYITHKTNPQLADAYMGASYGSNIVMRVKGEQRCLDAFSALAEAGIPCVLTSDDYEQFGGVRTPTGFGFGPIPRSEAQKFIKRFQLRCL